MGSADVFAWCLRITWKYYEKEKTEVYLKSLTGFGALHNGDVNNLHSHFYIKSKFDNKKLRNDLNRYRTEDVPPVGFRPLSISLLKKTEGEYYRYVCTKPESAEVWINGMDIPVFVPIEVQAKKKNNPNVIERLLNTPEVNNITYNYSALCAAVIDWYINNNKCLPMDGIMKQICRTLWLQMKKREDPKKYAMLRDKYISRICCDDMGVFETLHNYELK